MGTGQAAGVAAAVAVADGTTVHNVNIRKVQDILVDQDVPLPRNAKFEAKDPSYKEMVEEKQHGLYTDKAKLAKEQKEKGQALDLEFQEKFNAPPSTEPMPVPDQSEEGKPLSLLWISGAAGG